MESLASPTRSLKSVIISSTGRFPCHNKASFCMAESIGSTALKASCNFVINTPNVGNVILLLLVIECMYCSFHFWASPAVIKDSTKAIFTVSVSYIVLLVFRYTSHSCMKFSIFVLSLVNSVGRLMLYSFCGVRFMVVMSVEVVNGFVVVDAISSKGSSYWTHHSVSFLWLSSVNSNKVCFIG